MTPHATRLSTLTDHLLHICPIPFSHNVILGLLLLVVGWAAPSSQAAKLPSVWQEFESGGWHNDAKESAKASGGRFVSWFDKPDRTTYLTFQLDQPMRAAVVFIRYSRTGGPSFIDVSFGRNTADPAAAAPLAQLATPPTDGEENFRWISHPIGNLTVGEHVLVVKCPEASGGANLDVAGLVADDLRSRWMPPDEVVDGQLQGAGSTLTSSRPSSVYDPRTAAAQTPNTSRSTPASSRRSASTYKGQQIIQKVDEIKDPRRKLNYTMTWFGNDMAMGKDVPRSSGHTPHNVATIHVTPEGTVFTNVQWEEHGANVAEFKDGRWVNDARVGNHGGGRHIAANSKYIFFQGNRHRTGEPGIDRRDRSDISNQRANLHHDRKFISGMAATEEKLFVAIHDREGGESGIEVYDPDLKQLGMIEVAEAGLLSLDPQGHLWMLQRDSGKIIRLTQNGKVLPQSISLPDWVQASAIAADPKGRLLVADGVSSEQVLIYENIDTSPALASRFGEEGGAYSGVAGSLGPRRFVRLVGVGADQNGNIFTASRASNNGSTILMSHAPDGKLNWQRLCQVWIDCADLHPDDPNVVFSSTSRMRVDWDADPTPGNHWQAEALTVHHRKFPDEYRASKGGSGSTFVRRLSNGQLYKFVINMLGKDVHVYRFDPDNHGAIAVPAARVEERNIWVDANGDGLESGDEVKGKRREITVGHYVDSEGTIWNASHTMGIFRYPVEGFTSAGVPIYSTESHEHYEMPEGMTELRRVQYFPEHGRSLLVNGFTDDHPNVNHHWKRAGKVIRRFDDWQPGGEWKVRWQLVPPYEDRTGGNDGDANIMSFDVAGDYLFIAREGSSGAMGVKRGHVDVFRYDDASYVGWMQPTEEIGHVGIMDITHGLRAFKRANGEYLVFIEDSGKARVLVYRWKP